MSGYFLKREPPPDEERCIVNVYIRDTYRRTGRGKSGFEMHYSKRRCSRKAVENDRCRQHQNVWSDVKQ